MEGEEGWRVGWEEGWEEEGMEMKGGREEWMEGEIGERGRKRTQWT